MIGGVLQEKIVGAWYQILRPEGGLIPSGVKATFILGLKAGPEVLGSWDRRRIMEWRLELKGLSEVSNSLRKFGL